MLSIVLALAMAALLGQAGPAAAAGRRRHKRHARAAVTEATDTTDASSTPAGGARRVLVLPFQGPIAVSTRTAVRKALAAESTVALVALPEGAKERWRAGSDAERTVREQALKLDLAALVQGRIKRDGRSLQAVLTVLNGRDGEVLREITIQGRTAAALRASLRSELWAELGSTISGAASSPAPAPATASAEPAGGQPKVSAEPPRGETETDTETKTEAAPAPSDQQRSAGPHARRPAQAAAAADQEREGDEEESESARGACSALDLELAGGVLVRFFNYLYELRGALRADTQTKAPVGLGQVAFYPFALGSCGGAANLGVRFGYERMESITSRLAERPLATSASAYHAELLLRIPLGALTLTPSAGYYERRYTIAGEVVPNVDYRTLGGGLEAALKVGRWVFELGAGGRFILDSGEIESAAWFPHPTDFGLTGRARLGIALNQRFELLAGVDTEYYHFKFHFVPGGAYPNGIAGGAYDVYLQGLLALRVHLP